MNPSNFIKFIPIQSKQQTEKLTNTFPKMKNILIIEDDENIL